MATILQIANADRNLSALTKSLKAVGLEDKLTETGPFTLLGPVNLAFGRLTIQTLEELLKPVNINKLIDILSDHILVGKRMARDFIHGQKLKTISGKEVIVIINNDEIRINGSKLLARDRQGSNGVVHSIDTVYVST